MRHVSASARSELFWIFHQHFKISKMIDLALELVAADVKGRRIGGHRAIASVKLAIVMVAKLENVSDTAYGRTIWSR